MAVLARPDAYHYALKQDHCERNHVTTPLLNTDSDQPHVAVLSG